MVSMRLRAIRGWCVAVLILSGGRGACAAQPTISLRTSVVVVDVAEPSYVHYTVRELRQQIKDTTGSAPILSYDLAEAQQTKGTLVVVGRAMASCLAQSATGAPQITDSDPGEQGFILRAVHSNGNKPTIVAAGSDSAGTNYAVMQLRQY